MVTNDDDKILDDLIGEVRRNGADPGQAMARCPEHLQPELRTAIALGKITPAKPPAGADERLYEKIKSRFG
jgi:hypothetical protein